MSKPVQESEKREPSEYWKEKQKKLGAKLHGISRMELINQLVKMERENIELRIELAKVSKDNG
jgi:hypothetical protein